MLLNEFFNNTQFENKSFGNPEPEQQQMDANRRGRLGRERNAGLDEPDDAAPGSVQTGNGVYEYTVPTGQESLAQELGLQQHRGHWVSRVPIQRANFQFGRPQFHEIPSPGVAEGKEDKIKQLKQDYATAIHWSKNETSPQKREAARQKAEKIKRHLDTQYKQGVAEGGEKDRQWSNKDMERLRVATRDFDDIMASDGPEAFKQELIKKRIKTKPMVGPKGVLPEQGVAEGYVEQLDKTNPILDIATRASQDSGMLDGYIRNLYDYVNRNNMENDPKWKQAEKIAKDYHFDWSKKNGYPSANTNPELARKGEKLRHRALVNAVVKVFGQQGVAEGSSTNAEVTKRAKAAAQKAGKTFDTDVEYRLWYAITTQANAATRKADKKQGMAEGSNDTIFPNAEVIKSRNGRPVGEIYQDENGWGFFHYGMDSGNDFIDSREDAIEGLRDLHQETVRSRPDYTIKGVAEGYKEERLKGCKCQHRQGDNKKCPIHGVQEGVAEGMLDNPGSQDSPVASAIIRRILMQRTDLLAKHGPEKVGAAVDEVADFVGDVDEIGSSDVSGWVRHVEQMLGNVTKKPQPYNDPNWTKNLPKEKLDALAGARYKKDPGVAESRDTKRALLKKILKG
jgi:hypothetical protein